MRFALALPFIAVGGLCAADPVVSSSTATIKIAFNNATIVSSIAAPIMTANGSIMMPARTRSQFGYKYNGTTNADGVMRLTGGTMVDKDLVNLLPVYSSNVSTPITMIPGGEYAPACGRKEFTSTNLVGFMDWWIRDANGVIVKKTHGTATATNFTSNLAGMLTPTVTSKTFAGGKWTVKFGYTATWPSYITYPVYAENSVVKNGSATVTPVGLPTSFSSGTKIDLFSVTTASPITEVSWSIAGKTVKFKNNVVTVAN